MSRVPTIYWTVIFLIIVLFSFHRMEEVIPQTRYQPRSYGCISPSGPVDTSAGAHFSFVVDETGALLPIQEQDLLPAPTE